MLLQEHPGHPGRRHLVHAGEADRRAVSDVYTVETPVFAEPEAVPPLDALDVRGEKLAGVCCGIYNEAGGTDFGDYHGRIRRQRQPASGRIYPEMWSVPEGYSPNREKPARALRIEGWTYPVTVSIPDYADPRCVGSGGEPGGSGDAPGEELAFQAAVTGVGDYSEDVTWTVEGPGLHNRDHQPGPSDGRSR